MLAKLWKKVLLAICIIACIYNVMHKLVTSTSLEEQLKSIVEQSSLTDILQNNENKNEENSSQTEDVDVNKEKQETKKDNETIVVIY